ncbi:MAG: hypothetical protein ACI8T1_003815 [Verrucomicrobiales bacterium]|jgi:hypothetical protein
MRVSIFLLLLSAALSTLVSCSTTSIDDEYADFSPITRSDDPQQKALKTFASYDPSKKSAFSGKEFKGKEAYLRSNYEKKEYVDHPYYKLRKKGYFSDKKAFRTKDAREGKMASSWQKKENSWFKRTFSKKESRLGSKEFAKTDYRIPEGPSSLKNRSNYEKKDYPLEIIDEPNRDKEISAKDLHGLLNAQ